LLVPVWNFFLQMIAPCGNIFDSNRIRFNGYGI